MLTVIVKKTIHRFVLSSLLHRCPLSIVCWCSKLIVGRDEKIIIMKQELQSTN